MDYLCHYYRNEYIYHITYEMDMRCYDHFREDLGNNADQIICQVIGTCVWAYKYHEIRHHVPDSYIPYMLWFPLPRVEHWRTPTMCVGSCSDFRDKMKKRWQYLIVILQFWMDNNATIHMQGRQIWPVLPLAEIVKETANLILPDGFQIHWKHVVEDMPVVAQPSNHLEKAMLLFHQKTGKILKEQVARCQMPAYHSPHPEVVYQ